MIPTVGLAIAHSLCLPINSPSGLSLADYANKFIYISSFHTTQREILDAVQKVTNTTDSHWAITKADAQQHIDGGKAKLVSGDFYGMIDSLSRAMFNAGLGGDYQDKGLSNEVLGLPKEDMVEVLRV
jgi:hypothetical protein